MKLKALWKRFRLQRRAPAVTLSVPFEPRRPRPFQPLTQDESIAVLDDALQWLGDELRATLTLPDGPDKERRYAELRARDKAMCRDFVRLLRRQQGRGYAGPMLET